MPIAEEASGFCPNGLVRIVLLLPLLLLAGSHATRSTAHLTAMMRWFGRDSVPPREESLVRADFFARESSSPLPSRAW